MMKVTRTIKSGYGITPSSSILETNANRSEKRITKSAVFKDDFDDKKVSDTFREVKETQQEEELISQMDLYLGLILLDCFST
ncbi:hypothetical protein JTB14_026328 [Gonioctena quinquepunctata]|nr:hypothetical protein JTB14_026328 [Gonioctena quinquepunctata]